MLVWFRLFNPIDYHTLIIILSYLSGWWYTYPSENSWSESQLGGADIPNCFWKVIQNSMVPVTTNQLSIIGSGKNATGCRAANEPIFIPHDGSMVLVY